MIKWDPYFQTPLCTSLNWSTCAVAAPFMYRRWTRNERTSEQAPGGETKGEPCLPRGVSTCRKYAQKDRMIFYKISTSLSFVRNQSQSDLQSIFLNNVRDFRQVFVVKSESWFRHSSVFTSANKIQGRWLSRILLFIRGKYMILQISVSTQA